MPDFTPGPWKWENDDGNWRLRAQIDIETNGSCPNFDGNDPIVDDGSAGGEYSQTIDPTTSANAPLIAAAPELYDALETNVRWLREVVRAGWIDPQSTDVLTRIELQEAALLKAELYR